MSIAKLLYDLLGSSHKRRILWVSGASSHLMVGARGPSLCVHVSYAIKSKLAPVTVESVTKHALN